MKHSSRCWWLVVGPALALLLLLSVPTPARAQLSHLDKNQLIEALTEEHMSELLLHLAQKESSDPAGVQQIVVANFLITADNPAKSFDERLGALRQALDAQRKLIADFRDNPARPIWQTRLVELLLGNYLTLAGPAAAEFYSFGVPNAQQKQAFESVAGEALEQAIDAEFAIARLRDTLPFDKDYNAKYRGAFSDRLFQEYGERRTRYRAAQACFYAALLPDDHPYFKTLGHNRLVPLQAANPADEKKRLLSLAESRLKDLTGDSSVAPDAKALFQCLLARVLIARQNPAAALELLDKVIAADKKDLNDLTARLAKLVALSQQKDDAAVKRELAALTGHAEMQRMPFYRILAMDVAHQLAMRRAEALPPDQRPKAIEEAFQPYSDLVNDPGLDPGQRDAIKEFIDSRWESLYGNRADPTDLPPFVLQGLGSGLVDQGRAELNEAEAAGGGAPADKLRKDAVAKFQRAIGFFNVVLKQADATPRARASATYDLGVATISLDENNLDNVFKAVDTWVDLAQQNFGAEPPPAVQKCLEGAVTVLHRLMSRDDPPQEARPRYEKAARLLLDKYPDSAAAQQERADFAAAILMRDGKFQEAVDQFARVPTQHPLYYRARVLTLTCYRRLAEQAADAAARTALYDKVLAGAQQLQRDAKKELDGGIADPNRAAEARYALGQSRLAAADIYLDRDQPQNALPALDNWEKEFAQDPTLLSEGLGKRIVALYAAAQAAKGLEAAKDMLQRFPKEAPQVIKEVLDNIDFRLDRLKQHIAAVPTPEMRRQLEQQRLELAKAAEPVAKLLLDRGEEQHLSKAQLFPFQISLARSYRLAEKKQESLDLLLKVEKGLDPNVKEENELLLDTDLINGLAESYFALGMPPGNDKPDEEHVKTLREAEKRFAVLVNNLQRDPQTSQYPPLFWNAWMRTLQIVERVGTNIAKTPAEKMVASAVERLKAVDPNLGGEPYKTELQRLQRHYQVQQ